MIDPPRDYSVYDMSWLGPTASLISTVADLSRFYGLLLAGEMSTGRRWRRCSALSRSSPMRGRRLTMASACTSWRFLARAVLGP
jgi:hypothetical protein